MYKRWEAGQDSKRKDHARQSDKKSMPQFLAGLKQSILASLGMPMSHLAKNRSVSTATISRAVNEDLQMKAYKLYKRHILTDAIRAIRVDHGKRLVNDLKSHRGRIIFFSDEKNWAIDRSYNIQNDRWVASDRSNIPHVFKTEFPASAMTLGVIGSNRSIMPPFFFDPKERVGTDRYCEVMETVVILWMKAKDNSTPFIFQQDSAPAHKAKKTLAMLNSNNVPF